MLERSVEVAHKVLLAVDHRSALSFSLLNEGCLVVVAVFDEPRRVRLHVVRDLLGPSDDFKRLQCVKGHQRAAILSRSAFIMVRGELDLGVGESGFFEAVGGSFGSFGHPLLLPLFLVERVEILLHLLLKCFLLLFLVDNESLLVVALAFVLGNLMAFLSWLEHIIDVVFPINSGRVTAFVEVGPLPADVLMQHIGETHATAEDLTEHIGRFHELDGHLRVVQRA